MCKSTRVPPFETKTNSNGRASKPQIFKVRKVQNQRRWSKKESEELFKIAQSIPKKNWREISRSFPNKNYLACYTRYYRNGPNIIFGKWKKEEDDKILKLIEVLGTHWSKISKRMKTRNPKQIRERYVNVLNPMLNKGKFTKEEDEKIIRLISLFGKKWAAISKFFQDRSGDNIKNRFYSYIQKKLENEEAQQKVSEVIYFLNLALNSNERRH